MRSMTGGCALIKTMLKAFGILIDAGFATYGQWTDEQVLNKAQLYTRLLSEHPEIGADVVQETVWRYVRGQVGNTSQFPTAPDFLQACIDAHRDLYVMLAIGSSFDSKGNEYLHTISVRKDMPEGEKMAICDRVRSEKGIQPPDAINTPQTRSLEQAKAIVNRMLGIGDIIVPEQAHEESQG